MSSIKVFKTWAMTGCAAFVMFQGAAFAEEAMTDFNIRPQNLGAALNEFALQSGKEIFFVETEMKGRFANSLAGSYGTEKALRLLLDSTGISYRINELGTILIGTAAIGTSGFQKISYEAGENYESNLAVYDEDEKRDRMGSSILSEIIVTAQKREQSVIDVPISLAIYGGDLLRERGVSSFEGLFQQEPNVDFDFTGSNRSLLYLSIRGVNPGGVRVANADPATAVHVDGVYQASGAYLAGQLFDVERVEILKGPQGTLYGRNATAGVVNVISRKPTEELNGFLQAEYGNFDAVKIEAAVGGKIMDGVRIRLAGFYDYGGGYFINQGTGELAGTAPYIGISDPIESIPGEKGLGDKNLLAGKLILEADISDDTLLRLRAYVSRDRSENLYIETDGAYFGFTAPDQDFRTINTNRRPKLNTDVLGATITLQHHITDEWSLNAIVSYQKLTKIDDIIFIPRLYESFVLYENDLQQVTGELHASYESADGLHSFVGGIYGLHDSYSFNNRLFYRARTFGWDLQNIFDQKRSSYAIFGDYSWQFLQEWALTGGLRYTYDKSEFSGVSLNANTFGGPERFPDLPTKFDRDFDDSKVTGRLVLSFEPTENTLYYGSVSRGYRAGGFDGTTIINIEESDPIDSETVWAYELGAKYQTNFFALTTAAFFYDFSELQGATRRVIGVSGGGDEILSNVRTNVAEAEIYGAEINANFFPIEGLELGGGIGFLATKITSFVSADPAQAEDRIGNKLVDAPNVTANAHFRYEYPLTGAGLLGFVGAEARYTGESFTTIDNNVTKPDHTLVNARFGVEGLDNGWTFTVWGKNLLDEEYFMNLVKAGDGLAGVIAEPRSYGVSLAFIF